MIGSLPPRLRRAVSPYTGIVGAVEECLAATCEPRLFQASAEVGRGAGLVGGRLDHVTGIGGTGSSRAAAASAAVGEAIERYSATYVPGERLVMASARDLGDVAVSPGRFALFSARQHARAGFPYRPFTADARIAWIEGREIETGRPALLPAELVYLGCVPLGEGSIGYATSSGLACGDTVETALARALLEILERDAFMIAWASRLTLPLVESAGPGSRGVFERSGLRFAAVDLSVIHRLPTILGIVRAPTGFPGALGVGAAAAPTVEQAWHKALGEAFAVRSAGAKLALLLPGRDLGPRGSGSRRSTITSCTTRTTIAQAQRRFSTRAMTGQRQSRSRRSRVPARPSGLLPSATGSSLRARRPMRSTSHRPTSASLASR